MNFYHKGTNDTKNSIPNNEVRSMIYEVRFKSQISNRTSYLILRIFFCAFVVN